MLKILCSIFLFLAFSVDLAVAQKNVRKITVSGYVMDATCRPVAGALVLVDNKTTAVCTDNNGFYKVKISSDASVIGVMLSDNKVRSEFIDNRSEINFSLKEVSNSSLNYSGNGESDELVDIGISRIAVPKKDLLDKSADRNSPYSDIYEMIRGRVAGVDVYGQTIRIRGVNAVEGETDPLFVVDGSPVNSIDHVMPSSVESIAVLKGSTAAIYGSRGVNGVLVINLKKATPAKSRK